jgi:phosphoserine phosphatase SerB
MKKIKSFTVGMANSPDIMAARAVAESFGCIHHEHIFTADEAFDIVPKVIYHLETYEPELIRSSIPNYFLATLASQHTKVVLTGEGADELFAGYLYFRDAPSRDLLHGETLRIWDALHNVNLQRSDRMSMAHGLEARVPFLDVDMLQEAFGHVDPAVKMHNHEEGKIEKWALRALFEESGIPADVVWRTKAMQCEGVGVDWVSTLQQRCEEMVSDADFQNAAATFPINPPQSKEEYYYRSLFEQHFPNMDKFVHVWPGGCRAGGAPWDNSQYTRAGLKDTAQLTHGLQDGVESKVKSVKAGGRGAGGSRTTGPKMMIGTLTDHDELARALTTGGDSRSVIDAETGRNSYHCPPMPLEGAIVRGSCTGSPPTLRGVTAAAAQMAKLASLKAAAPTEQYAAAFGEEVESVRSRLASALDLPEGSALVLCASGTCAEYVPLAIARELCPTAPIKSVLACDGETGRGGPDACSGKYFNTHTPFYGQDEARQVVGAPLGMGDVELIQLPARTADGEPADSAAALAAARGTTTTSDGAEPPAWVVRQVIGSKTGLSTPTPASMMEGDDASRLFEVIDLCQLRSPLTEVGSHLSSGRTVMLTGSKFFQGSVFSAAVALPAALVARLAANAPSAPPLPAGLSHFLSAHEVPRELSHWRAQLPSHATNEGLLLRWHTALPLVEAVGALDPSRRAALEAAWVARVGGLVESTPRLEGFSSAFGIVSVSCTLPGGRPAGKAELQKVHAWLAADLSAAPGAAACASAATSVFIGQPVAISDGGEQSVVRLALGAELLLDMDAAGEREGVDTTAAEDAAAVTKLGWIVDNYAALEAWSDSGSATTTTTTTVSAAQPHVEKAKSNVVMKLLDVTETVVPRRMPPTLHPNGKTLRNGKAPSLHRNGHTALLWTALRAEVSRRKTAAAEHGMAVAHAKQTLLDADAVCFDVDGTVISEEAINLLADQLGLGAPVRALTLDAQEGRLQFDEALRQRLLLMRPSSADLAQLLECSPAHQMLTPGVLYLISLLRARGTAIYFVSGGFIQLVTPIAQAVGVPRENVYANQIPLNADGSFMEHGLSELLASSPTASKGGKAKVVRQLKEAHSYKKVVMVGDGATDLEARDMDGGADAFIGFGGVFVRDVVRDRACWYVTDFDDLSAHLEVHLMPGAAAATRASAIDRFRA